MMVRFISFRSHIQLGGMVVVQGLVGQVVLVVLEVLGVLVVQSFLLVLVLLEHQLVLVHREFPVDPKLVELLVVEGRVRLGSEVGCCLVGLFHSTRLSTRGRILRGMLAHMG